MKGVNSNLQYLIFMHINQSCLPLLPSLHAFLLYPILSYPILFCTKRSYPFPTIPYYPVLSCYPILSHRIPLTVPFNCTLNYPILSVFFYSYDLVNSSREFLFSPNRSTLLEPAKKIWDNFHISQIKLKTESPKLQVSQITS